MKYSVFGILYHTQHTKTNDRRGTAKSTSDICNDILYNMKDINSFGNHLMVNYIYKVPAYFGIGDNADTFPSDILNI